MTLFQHGLGVFIFVQKSSSKYALKKGYLQDNALFILSEKEKEIRSTASVCHVSIPEGEHFKQKLTKKGHIFYMDVKTEKVCHS